MDIRREGKNFRILGKGSNAKRENERERVGEKTQSLKKKVRSRKRK